MRSNKYGLKSTRCKLYFAVWVCLLPGCTSIPDGVTAVSGFEADRYLGKWYEIARLEHSFERGLEQVSAEYSKRDDGGIRVLNRGYNPQTREWKRAEGKAYFIGDPSVGRLRVSFFGPFYSSYNIIDLDADAYQYAVVCGPDRSYLWILSRTPQMDAELQQRLRDKAKSWGFAVDGLISVRQ
ncbi:MAG: lipocalin family protein [Gammaproteobacteria bacterium]